MSNPPTVVRDIAPFNPPGTHPPGTLPAHLFPTGSAPVNPSYPIRPPDNQQQEQQQEQQPATIVRTRVLWPVPRPAHGRRGRAPARQDVPPPLRRRDLHARSTEPAPAPHRDHPGQVPALDGSRGGGPGARSQARLGHRRRVLRERDAGLAPGEPASRSPLDS